MYYYTQKEDLLTKADQMIQRMSKPALGNPFGFGQLLSAIYLKMKTPLEISIIKYEEKSKLGNYINKKFLPNAITAIVSQSSLSELDKYPYFKNRSINNNIKNNNREFAYVCKDFSCSLPLSTIEELEKNIS
jgi:uncharacterized protein YyaL (SSP411 family)